MRHPVCWCRGGLREALEAAWGPVSAGLLWCQGQKSDPNVTHPPLSLGQVRRTLSISAYSPEKVGQRVTGITHREVPNFLPPPNTLSSLCSFRQRPRTFSREQKRCRFITITTLLKPFSPFSWPRPTQVLAHAHMHTHTNTMCTYTQYTCIHAHMHSCTCMHTQT